MVQAAQHAKERMGELQVYWWLLCGWMGLALAVFMALFFWTAPYGRHERRGWGATVGDRTGWVLMEAPAALVMPLYFVLRQRPSIALDWVWLALWESHYLYRAFIYPELRRTARRPMPLSVVAMGALFNGVNGYLNGRYLFALAPPYALSWLGNARFICGVLLFVSGFVAHVWTDRRLRSLRLPGQNAGYRIPQGGLFRWVSCPNYLGEIVEWCGWALATWSLAGLSFAIWTVANLGPRARAHHHWYRAQFADYPANRKALLPWLW